MPELVTPFQLDPDNRQNPTPHHNSFCLSGRGKEPRLYRQVRVSLFLPLQTPGSSCLGLEKVFQTFGSLKGAARVIKSISHKSLQLNFLFNLLYCNQNNPLPQVTGFRTAFILLSVLPASNICQHFNHLKIEKCH